MYHVDHPEIINRECDSFTLYPKVQGILEFLKDKKSKKALEYNNLIALYGEWGSGKSSVIKTVCEDLKENNAEEFLPFIFEAWKYEKDDNLPLSIFDSLMFNIFKDEKTRKHELTNIFYKGLKSFTNGITVKTHFIDFDPSKMKSENSLYINIEKFINSFKIVLKNKVHNKKIVVFIDDLDRCEDESIINLLTSLKLMFSFEEIVFVCCIDRDATIEALKRKYSNNQEKAESFLDKLFLFDFNIFHKKENYLFKEKGTIALNNYLRIILAIFDIANPRRQKKIYNKIISLNNFFEKENISVKDPYFNTEFVSRILFYFFISLQEVDSKSFMEIFNMNESKALTLFSPNNSASKSILINDTFRNSSMGKYLNGIKPFIDRNLSSPSGKVFTIREAVKGINEITKKTFDFIIKFV